MVTQDGSGNAGTLVGWNISIGWVAALLRTLLIDFSTPSRARQTNDNALAESKKRALVRKLFGHAHISCISIVCL